MSSRIYRPVHKSLSICFINLPAPHLKTPSAQVPLGILYLAAILNKYHYSVAVNDLSRYITDVEALEALPRVGVYGITCTSMQLLHANRFAKLLKLKYPTCIIILGGPGTLTPEYVDWIYVDSIVLGEAEISILKILSDIEELGRPKQIYKGSPVENLNTLPLPARHLISNQGGDIFAYHRNYIGSSSAQIITSRGCPFKCSFCASPKLNPALRFRNAVSIEDEVKTLVQDFNIKQFRIADDTFFSKKKRCYDLLKIFSRYGCVFRISTRVKPLDEDLWRAARDSGLKEFSFGIESFDKDVLRGLKKLTTVEDNIRALEMAAKLGISTRILMMIHTPFQTSKTIALNKEALEKLPYTVIACTHFLPLPGSDIWYFPHKYGINIVNRNLDDYNFYGYGTNGRRNMKEIFTYTNADTNRLAKESEDFLLYLEEGGRVNRG